MRKGLNRIFLIVLFSLFVINVSALSGINVKAEAKAKLKKAQPQKLELLANNGQIVLTAELDPKYREYRNFKLKIGQHEKSFDWRSIANIGFGPSMRLLDLGTNRNLGIGVFLLVSQGTGVFRQNAHVIRTSDFKEIPVEDPLGIIQRHVKTLSTNEGIVIDIDGNRTVLDKNYLNSIGIINPNQELIYRYQIIYGTRNNTLSVDVGLSNGNLTYIGNFHIDYTYKDDALVMERISFQKLK